MKLIDKIETKLGVVHSIGCDADDWLEAAKRSAAGFDGAKQALGKATKDVQALTERVDKDLEEGKLDGMDALAIAKFAKQQIARCIASLATSTKHYENLQLTTLGEVAAYEKLVDHCAKIKTQEVEKVGKIKDAIETGELNVEPDGSASRTDGSNGKRIPGTRPAKGIAAQRKAEDAAANKSNGKSNGKPKTSKRKRQRKCGTCGKPGHTARSCPDAAHA